MSPNITLERCKSSLYVLGLNAYHGDSSAALIFDGNIVAAVEEERFTRQKHWAGLPLNAIQFCLEYGGVRWDQLDHVAINSDSRVNAGKKFSYLLKTRPTPRLVLDKIKTRLGRENVVQKIESECGYAAGNVKLHLVEHHLSHLASAYYPSGYESSVLLSIDGFGDFSSAAWGTGVDGEIKVDDYVHFPHSLGVFYQSITQFLGFKNYGDEYKVMGLASHGEPTYAREIRQMVRICESGKFELDTHYFRHHNESINYTWQGGTPQFADLYSIRLNEILGSPRKPDEPITETHKNIASSAQLIYEESLFHLLNRLHNEYKIDNLALSGGCAMNSVANGKITGNTPFQQIYVQPAAGDAGGAIGAALVVSTRVSGKNKLPTNSSAYLGPEYSNDECRVALQKNDLLNSKTDVRVEFWKEKTDQLLEFVATHLSQGSVVGWFQGRVEWGPRALGNRSILADPRRHDIQELLNQKIKRRESFRPFAPSILREHVAEWFEIDDDVPFMEKVFPIQKEKRPQIPGVTHIDGTGRLQTVERTANPKYYDLIEAFHQITGVPVLLNTSFNENEPIVCSPEQALDCFLRTNMDLLVLEDTTILRDPV